jgi:peroxiredoxin Q/BCP
MMIEEGAKAPDFCLSGIDAEGKEREFCLKDFLNQGRDLILYFYPKDETPGCTIEACDFRDNFNRLTGRAQVVGVSADSIASHHKFQKNNNLNFPLLSDPQKEVMRQYDAYGEKKTLGVTTTGVIRSTYLIDPQGMIKKKWHNVHAKGHVDEVLESLLGEKSGPPSS